jgi:hypothetical protein
VASPVAAHRISAAERVRRQFAPVVAAVACSLAVLCTTSLAALLTRPGHLPGLSDEFVGLLALAATLTLATALAGLLVARHVGAGLPLMVGAASAAIALVVGDDLIDTSDLLVAAIVSGLAAGGLVGGAASLPFELPWPAARLTTVAWVFPLVVGWPVQAWAALTADAAAPRLVVPHPHGLAFLGVAIVAVFGAQSLMVQPSQARSDSSGWRDAWLALVGALVVLCLLAILVGVDASLHLFWLRPVVLVATALALAIWVLVTMLVPTPAAKIAFLAVSFVGASVAPSVQLLVVADAFGPGSSGSVGSAIVVIAAGAGGTVIGYRRPRQGVVIGLCAVAAMAFLAWPGYGSGWVSTTVLAMLIGAAAATAAGGFALGLESEAALRLVSFGFVSGLVTGLLLAIPLGWALIGDLALTPDSSRANARVFLGLVFSAAVLVAAHSAVLGHRIDRRLQREAPQA